jgi:hypothetical protein
MINDPFGVAVDTSGNVFFADQGNNRVREVVKATGTIVTVAGTGSSGFNGDNIAATSAMLNQPNGVAVDSSGNVFISDWHNNRVREVVKATGTIITVAGYGVAGFSGDGGQATSAQVNYTGGVAVDASGNIFIADSSNERVREVVRATGIITTVAGSGTMGFGGDGGAPTSAAMNLPYAVAVDSSGNLFIADSNNERVREVAVTNNPYIGWLSAPTWTVNQPGFSGSLTVTGGTAPYSNLIATGLPPGVTATLNGGTITLSGTPTAAGIFNNATLSVQDAAGLTGSLTFSLTVNAAPTFGSLTIAQWPVEVRNYTGYIPVNGGTGPFTLVGQSNLPPGLSAVMGGIDVSFTGIPTTAGIYSNVQLTVADAVGATVTGTFTLTINATPPGGILTIAGTGSSSYGGDGGPANQASLYHPESVAVDASGNVFIADYFNNRIREIVKATGNIITVAGTGVASYSGDGGPATSAQLSYPAAVAVDASGNLFIADDNRVREVVQATGNIITVAGNGTATDSGDGGLATAAGIAGIQAIALDASGDIFIADGGNRVREVLQSTGNIVTIAGTGTAGFSGDGGPATAAMLNSPRGVAVDANGNVFIADANNERVREVVHATGNIITIAGATLSGFSGDGGLATAARLYDPTGLAVDSYGDLFIADQNNQRIREIIVFSGAIVTVAGSNTGYVGDGGLATAASLNYPNGVALDAGGDMFIADSSDNSVREVLANPNPVLGPLSATAWTVNQPGLPFFIPIVPPTTPGGMTTSAGSSGYTVSATGLPPGVSAALNGAVITLSGTPTATGTFGNITVSLLDGSGNIVASRTYSMTINPALSLGNLGWMTTWTVGRSGYPGGFPISGGTGPLTLTSQANLPPGLTAAISAGNIAFNGTPTTVGTYNNVQLTVTDSTGASITGTYTININPLPTFSPPSATVWEANQPGFSSTITILGGTAPFGNFSYSGLPAGLYISQNGLTQFGNVLTIMGTPTTPGTYTVHLTVEDFSLYWATGTFSLTIAAPGPATTLSVTNYPTAMTAGSSGSFSVTARDSLGFVATGYRGTVSLGSSDPLTGAPTTYTFTAADNGVHTFNFTLDTAGSQQLYARDSNGINGFSGLITVSPAALDHFAVTAPPYPASYYSFNVTVSARDAYNNTIPGYTGTVHFTSSDSAATLPADYTYTPGDQGSHTFSATLQTAGTQTIAVNDSNNTAVTGTASVLDLNYIPGLHFVINPSVTTTTAGTAFDVTLTALDQYNNVAVHYVGTVSFSSTDRGSAAVLPANYTFTAVDAGVHTFTGGVTLVTAGNQTLSVIDNTTVASSGYGLTSVGIAVNPAAVSTLAISGLPATVTRGATQTFTVSGKDPYGNTVTSYSGTVHFTSSDLQAVLPPDTTLTGGTGTFQVVFASLGTQSLSVADTSNGALPATQAGITVNAAPAVRLAVTGFPSATTAGVTGAFSVAAIDAYGYVAPGYSGTVHFTSSDPLAVLPANVALTNGTGSFSATFKTAGVQWLTATDTANGTINGTESSIGVAPAAATTLILASFPTSTTAGVSGTATVTARDAYGNVATGYTGMVHFTSTDPQAVLPADYTFSAADQGVHTFAATLRTAGSQGLAVADTAGGVAGGSEGGITVSAAAAVTLAGTAPAGATAGSAFAFAVRALDAFGNQAPGYTGTVHFTSSDAHAALPADYTFTAADGGSHVFVATLTTAGSKTLVVRDTGSAGVSGTQVNVNVAAGAATAFVVTGVPTVTAGVALTVTVTAIDAYGNVATGYTGTARFGSSDYRAVQPADYTFTAADAGTHSFSAMFKTAGSQCYFVQDPATPNINGTYWSTVTPAAASGLQVDYPSTTTAGTAQNLMIFVCDPYGNTVPGYTGTVHVTSSDGQAILPADYTFTAADWGEHTLSLTLKTAGLQGITVQDLANGFTSTVSGISVTAAAASRFTIGGFPSPVTAGASGTLAVTAYDVYGNVATGYVGTLHFTSSDARAGLPADYTFTGGDQGTHTFSASLGTAGTQSLSVTDTANAGLTASQTGITVVAGAASRFTVSGYPATTAGTSHSFTVTVTDAYGNLVTGYRGTVRFSSSDSQAGLPSSYTFTAADNGVHTFSATLKTAGSQSLTVTDSANAYVTGSQTGIAVTAAAATHFSVTAPANVTNGVAFAVTVTALDAYGNVATGYLGTVHFTSSDHKGILPSDYTFVAADDGVHTFMVTLKSSGTQTVTATDTHTGSTKGSVSVRVS